MFYVLSDDIKLSKVLLQGKVNDEVCIKFPGSGSHRRPGNGLRNDVFKPTTYLNGIYTNIAIYKIQ